MAALKTLKGDETSTSYGVFFPTDYVLAVFADPNAADRAAAALEVAGFDPSDVLVTGSDDVLTQHRDLAADVGLFGRFRQFLGRHFGDQDAMMNDVVAHARQGHTFVLAYAPDGKQTDRAATALHHLHPAILRKYGGATIKDLR